MSTSTRGYHKLFRSIAASVRHPVQSSVNFRLDKNPFLLFLMIHDSLQQSKVVAAEERICGTLVNRIKVNRCLRFKTEDLPAFVSLCSETAKKLLELDCAEQNAVARFLRDRETKFRRTK